MSPQVAVGDTVWRQHGQDGTVLSFGNNGYVRVLDRASGHVRWWKHFTTEEPEPVAPQPTCPTCGQRLARRAR